tara:strand:+ start:219 stop:476 length:258 start_codon:yes stop_codon:yes gene_type:complete
MVEEVADRTDEQLAVDYAAMGDCVAIITDVISGDRRSDYSVEDRQNCVDRNVAHLITVKAMDDWGDEDFTAADSAIAAGNGYTAS